MPTQSGRDVRGRGQVSVLVTPGNLRSALAVTRSLGKRGIPVTVADERPRSIAATSRYCRTSIRVPGPARADKAFVNAIYQTVSLGGYRVVIPTDDVSLTLLAEVRPRFEGIAALPFPDLETITLAHDKGALTRLAEEQGIPVPQTIIVRDPADVTKAIGRIGFPAVVKSRFSWLPRDGGWVRGGEIHYAHNAKELEAACQAVQFPLVQEYIPGEGRGMFLLMNRGKLRAAFAHRRIREKPPSGGVSVLSESIGLDARLLDYSERLLDGLKWHGVAMIEFKRDARDGVVKLLEINGRFWGSLQLAVDAGVDFPYLLYQVAIDGDTAPVFSYREGVRLRWGLGNLDWLFLRLRRDRKLGKRLGAIYEFLTPSARMAKSEICRWDDPVPAIEELSQYIGHILCGTIKTIRRGRPHE